MLDIERELLELSINERQCIAAICFERFCKKYNIVHEEITIFIEHIWKVSDIQGKLVDWINEFSKLSITGLGDEIPVNIIKIIPENLRTDFELLTELVVETSATSWFAAESTNSIKMVLEIFKMLRKHKISVPKVRNYNIGTEKNNGWILKIPDEKIKEWRLNI